MSHSLGSTQRAILAEIDARPHNQISLYNWRATIAPDVHATMQISKVLCSDRQWVKQSSFSRALASLIRHGYLETVSLVPIIVSEGDPPFWLHHLSDGVCMRVPRDRRLYVRRSFSEN